MVPLAPITPLAHSFKSIGPSNAIFRTSHPDEKIDFVVRISASSVPKNKTPRNGNATTNTKTATDVETGTSAWGTDSTRLWDNYVTHYGGSFHSVDIRSEPARRLKGQVGKRTRLVTSDSVNFL